MRVFLCLSLLLVFTLSVSGCVSVQKSIDLTPQSLESSLMPRFNDIPHPMGFSILPEKSFAFESGGVRAGKLKYTGKADAVDVVSFYKNQMPIYNWALLNIIQYGEYMLNFERENEGCVIIIKPIGNRVEISISLAPKYPIPLPEIEIESEEQLSEIPQKK